MLIIDNYLTTADLNDLSPELGNMIQMLLSGINNSSTNTSAQQRIANLLSERDLTIEDVAIDIGSQKLTLKEVFQRADIAYQPKISHFTSRSAQVRKT